ncbi:hypothetical protein C8Q75DRAFT_540092 [Abortiporus biennis]|nr:hypothetical protein C8Q75DRAFT_540092 [Abortiporus biennis]
MIVGILCSLVESLSWTQSKGLQTESSMVCFPIHRMDVNLRITYTFHSTLDSFISWRDVHLFDGMYSSKSTLLGPIINRPVSQTTGTL